MFKGTIILSIITAYIGTWVAGFIGAGTDERMVIDCIL